MTEAMIHTLRSTDLLRAFTGAGRIGVDRAQTWDKVGAASSGALSAVSVARGLVLNGDGERCSVSTSGMSLHGLASVRPRSGPRAWEVDRFYMSPDVEKDGVALLEKMCSVAGERGGERIFLRLSGSSPVMGIAAAAGFASCARETLYRRDPPRSETAVTTKFIRPSLFCDEYAVFRLYCECAPSWSKSSYAVTFDQWSDAMEPSGRYEQRGIYEADSGLRGWARVAYGRQTANRMEVMVHQEEESGTWDDLVTWGLQQGKPRTPFGALVPDHQTILARVLEKKGFIPTGEYHLMVKSTAARVKESALARASA